MQNACMNNGGTINNSEEEMEVIKTGILEEARSSQIPSELILAVIMQESKGCVRAPTSAHSAANPGLMQCSGTATCNSGTPVFPCPSDTIRAMIHEGTAGDGLATTLKNSLEAFAGITDESKWYKAVRRYNAGPNMMSAEDLTQGPTACYASDIANRLVNPFADSHCGAGVITSMGVPTKAQLDKGGDKEPAKPNKETPSTPSTNQPEKIIPANPWLSGQTDQIDSGVKPEPSTVSEEAPIIMGAVTPCKAYYLVKAGDTCANAGIEFQELRKLNDGLNELCTNLWSGYRYCIAV